jgi:hypothetical protein
MNSVSSAAGNRNKRLFCGRFICHGVLCAVAVRSVLLKVRW